MNLFILALFAVPVLSVIVWHFAFLIAVNKHYADRREGQPHGHITR